MPQQPDDRRTLSKITVPFKCVLKEANFHSYVCFVEDAQYPEAQEPLGLVMDLVHLVTTEEVP